MTTRNIPFHVARLEEDDISEVVAVLRSGWLTTGPRTARFERGFERYVKARYAVALNSCTAALHLAMEAVRIGPGDEVITTPLTFCATVNAILRVGATPVLADVGVEGNIDPNSVSDRITAKTRAILPVHYAGYPCEMDRLSAIARLYGLTVIEDAAHALGAEFRGVPIGASEGPYASRAVAFSFYATKNLTTGEGGMLTTPEPEIHERVRLLALHGITKDAWNRYAQNGKWFYEVLEPGFKYNLSDIQSALGVHQLERLEKITTRRAKLAALYTQLLSDVNEVEPAPDCSYGRHCWHLYVIRLKLETMGIGRDRFIEELAECGVGTSVHFIPIPLHPFFSPYSALQRNQCPRALALYKRILSLPLYPSLEEEDVIRIVASIKQIIANARLQNRSSFATIGSNR